MNIEDRHLSAERFAQSPMAWIEPDRSGFFRELGEIATGAVATAAQREKAARIANLLVAIRAPARPLGGTTTVQ